MGGIHTETITAKSKVSINAAANLATASLSREYRIKTDSVGPGVYGTGHRRAEFVGHQAFGHQAFGHQASLSAGSRMPRGRACGRALARAASSGAGAAERSAANFEG